MTASENSTENTGAIRARITELRARLRKRQPTFGNASCCKRRRARDDDDAYGENLDGRRATSSLEKFLADGDKRSALASLAKDVARRGDQNDGNVSEAGHDQPDSVAASQGAAPSASLKEKGQKPQQCKRKKVALRGRTQAETKLKAGAREKSSMKVKRRCKAAPSVERNRAQTNKDRQLNLVPAASEPVPSESVPPKPFGTNAKRKARKPAEAPTTERKVRGRGIVRYVSGASAGTAEGDKTMRSLGDDPLDQLEEQRVANREPTQGNTRSMTRMRLGGVILRSRPRSARIEKVQKVVNLAPGKPRQRTAGDAVDHRDRDAPVLHRDSREQRQSPSFREAAILRDASARLVEAVQPDRQGQQHVQRCQSGHANVDVSSKNHPSTDADRKAGHAKHDRYNDGGRSGSAIETAAPMQTSSNAGNSVHAAKSSMDDRKVDGKATKRDLPSHVPSQRDHGRRSRDREFKTRRRRDEANTAARADRADGRNNRHRRGGHGRSRSRHRRGRRSYSRARGHRSRRRSRSHRRQNSYRRRGSRSLCGGKRWYSTSSSSLSSSRSTASNATRRNHNKQQACSAAGGRSAKVGQAALAGAVAAFEILSADACLALSAFTPACRVQLKGLEKNADLNGKCGSVLAPGTSATPPVAGTVKVHLDEGGEVSVKAANLELLPTSVTSMESLSGIPKTVIESSGASGNAPGEKRETKHPHPHHHAEEDTAPVISQPAHHSAISSVPSDEGALNASPKSIPQHPGNVRGQAITVPLSALLHGSGSCLGAGC